MDHEHGLRVCIDTERFATEYIRVEWLQDIDRSQKKMPRILRNAFQFENYARRAVKQRHPSHELHIVSLA